MKPATREGPFMADCAISPTAAPCSPALATSMAALSASRLV